MHSIIPAAVYLLFIASWYIAGGFAHARGSKFLGQTVDLDGVSFYLMAWAWPILIVMMVVVESVRGLVRLGEWLGKPRQPQTPLQEIRVRRLRMVNGGQGLTKSAVEKTCSCGGPASKCWGEDECSTQRTMD